MNKYQEALVDIKCDTYNFIENNYDDAFKMIYNKQFKLLQELVDKTTPKKFKKILDYSVVCPSCGHHLDKILGRNYDYCPTCGQKLDWSDINE